MTVFSRVRGGGGCTSEKTGFFSTSKKKVEKSGLFLMNMKFCFYGKMRGKKYIFTFFHVFFKNFSRTK
jgi:hypothetical protein